MTTDRQRFACSAINRLATELETYADRNGVICIKMDELEQVAQVLKREIRKG